uniref:Secreted protein n=1 Tax=Anopheles darlingi TaxID=43151 RepID=A0A2M4DK68_ANODA
MQPGFRGLLLAWHIAWPPVWPGTPERAGSGQNFRIRNAGAVMLSLFLPSRPSFHGVCVRVCLCTRPMGSALRGGEIGLECGFGPGMCIVAAAVAALARLFFVVDAEMLFED